MTSAMTGRVAVVTGGSRGIGAAIAEACVRHGARAVIVGDLVEPSQTLRTVASPARGPACQIRFVRTDVSRNSDVEELIAAGEEFGGVDLMVCNAGIALADDGPNIPEDHYHRLVSVNLDGVFFGAQAAARRMRVRSKPGSIVMISSMGGLRGSAATVVYSATKGAVIMLARSLADALGPSGIRVNAICPGVIDTDLSHASPGVEAAIPILAARTPLRRIGRPEEVAEAVVWLGSDLASFVTGAVLAVDGGLSAVL